MQIPALPTPPQSPATAAPHGQRRGKHRRGKRGSGGSQAGAPFLSPEQTGAFREAGIQIQSHAGGGRGWGSNYAAVNSSPNRGYLIWSSLDTRKELTRYDRQSLIADSRSLVANSGYGRVLLTLARMVGTQRPQARTQDETWNTLAEADFEFCGSSALISDTRGLYNFWQVQPLLQFLKLRDGEVFLVLTETESGRARYAIYEAHRVTGAPDTSSSDQWFDGIRLNTAGAAVQYFLADPDKSGDGRTIGAANVIHLAHRDGLAPHGVPALAHAIIDLKDLLETRGMTKAALKIAGMLGLAIEQDGQDNPMRPIAAGELRTGPSQWRAKQEEKSPTTAPAEGGVAIPTDRGTKYEDLMDVGGSSAVATLKPGQKAKVLHDDRPSPNVREFHYDLLAGVAIGLGLPPQFLYFLENQTGPLTRLTMRRAEEWIRGEQDHLREVLLNRWWAYAVAKSDKMGFIATTRPNDWWRVEWQRPAAVTIDVGRDGKLELDQLDAGATTLREIVESQGGFWEDTLTQRRREVEKTLTMAKELAADFGIPITEAMALLNNRHAPQRTAPPVPTTAAKG